MEQNNFTFKKYAWNQFKKNKPALYSLYILITLILIAVFAPFIANDQPLYAKYKGESVYPAFATLTDPNVRKSFTDLETGKIEELQYDITDWRQLDLETVIWAPIPYSPDKGDRYNREYVSPFGEQRIKNANKEIIEAPNSKRSTIICQVQGRKCLPSARYINRP